MNLIQIRSLYLIAFSTFKSTIIPGTNENHKTKLDNRIEWAQELGMKQMILSTFWLPNSSTVDDYHRAAGELNIMAEKTDSAGIQMGFHNHHMEFEEIDGELIYDALLDEFDPDLVKMQFQVAVVNIGSRDCGLG